MAIKIAYVKISSGKIELPEEFLKIFPQETDLYVALDEEKQRLTIYAQDPSKPRISEFLDALEELNEGLSSDEYAEPVPEHELRRRKTNSGEKDE